MAQAGQGGGAAGGTPSGRGGPARAAGDAPAGPTRAASDLSFDILGPLLVNGADLREAGVRPQACHFLALLLARGAGHFVPSHVIFDALWPGSAPGDREAHLNVLASMARGTFGLPTNVAKRVLASTGTAFRLNVAPAQIDATLFERLARAGHEAADPRTALIYVEDALALVRGRAFGGLAAEAGVVDRAAELDELVVGARLRRAAALLALGDHVAAAAASAALVGEHPADEALREFQMRALHRSGRLPEAIVSYRSYRRAQGLAFRPGPAIERLADQIFNNRPVPDQPFGPTAGPARSEDDVAVTDELTLLCALWRARPCAPGVPSGTGERALAVEDGQGRVATLEHGRLVATFDDPERAVATAIELAGRRAQPARVGIHGGAATVLSGRETGPALALARRVAVAARPGQVLLTETAADKVLEVLGEQVELHGLGAHRLAGWPLPEPLHELRDGRLAASPLPPRSLDSLPSNLAPYTDRFVGRRRETEAVAQLIGDHHLVTLVGPGGCGKTRLATHVAGGLVASFGDGAFRVDLTDVRDPDLVPTRVCDELGLPRNRLLPPSEVVVQWLREREVLLLLDNCEHLAEACGRLATRIRDECAAVRMLATSRVRLGASGEHVWPVPPLGLPEPGTAAGEGEARADAVRLLADRVNAVGELRFDGAAAGLASRLVRLLDGLPLAIEFAAARVGALGLAEVVESLERAEPGDERLGLLDGDRPAHARHETTRVAIGWSHALLSADQAGLLCRLAVFAGAFTPEDVEAVVANRETGARELLGDLVQCSLVTEEGGRAGEGAGGPCYRLLGPVRDFAAAELAATTDSGTLGLSHAEWFLDVAEKAELCLHGSDERSALQRFDEIQDNVLAALRWAIGQGSGELAARIVGATWFYWYTRGALAEGRAWADRALAVGGGSPGARAKARNASAHLAYWQGDFAHTEDMCERLLADPELAADRSARAWAAMGLGAVGLFRSVDLERPLAMGRLSVALLREDAGEWALSYALVTLGVLTWFGGDDEGAVAPLDEAVAIQRRLGPGVALSSALRWRGLIAGVLKHRDLAHSCCEESLELSVRHGDRTGVAFALAFLGTLARYEGDLEWAQPQFAQALAASGEIGELIGMAWALNGVAGCACENRDFALAARLLATLDSIATATGTRLGPAERAAASRDRVRCRAALEEECEGAFDEAWEAGAGMDPEVAVAQALQYAADYPVA